MFRLSTGLRDFMLTRGSLKDAFRDGVLNIYSGSQVATADAAVVGTLLAQISLASGSWTAGTPSTAQVTQSAVTATGGAGDTVAMTVNGTLYSFVTGAGTTDAAAKGLAALINADPAVEAVSTGGTTGTESMVVMRARHAGVSFTAVSSSTGTATIAATETYVANVRLNGLQFGTSTAGVLSKETGVWSGIAPATGIAGWFRFKANAVDTDTSSSTLIRLDGAVASSGSDMSMNTSVTSGATITVDSCSFTMPAQ